MRRIAHLSDLHFGTHDERIVASLQAILARLKPDLTIVSGDFTQRAKRAEFAQARAFLSSIAGPKLVVPGNHDIPLWDPFRRFFRPLRRYEEMIAPIGVPEAFFADDEIAVLGINTARSLTFKNGRVSHEQMTHIRQSFAAVPDGATRILVSHHPLEAPHGTAQLDLAGRAERALDAIAEAGVRILLSGHYHLASSGPPAPKLRAHGWVVAVHAGTATSTRVREADANTFNLLTIDGPHLTVAVMHAEAGGFVELRASFHLYEGAGWTPSTKDSS